jgi:hypothetical protein
MAIALRPRLTASKIRSRWGSHALALGARPGGVATAPAEPAVGDGAQGGGTPPP